MLELIVNGRTHRVDVEFDMPLRWVLRDHLGGKCIRSLPLKHHDLRRV